MEGLGAAGRSGNSVKMLVKLVFYFLGEIMRSPMLQPLLRKYA